MTSTEHPKDIRQTLNHATTRQYSSSAITQPNMPTLANGTCLNPTNYQLVQPALDNNSSISLNRNLWLSTFHYSCVSAIIRTGQIIGSGRPFWRTNIMLPTHPALSLCYDALLLHVTIFSFLRCTCNINLRPVYKNECHTCINMCI